MFPLVEKYYGDWQRGYVPPQIPVEPEQTAERRVDVQYDGQTLPHLRVVYKLPAFDPADKSFVAIGLLADLAFGETSATYRKLVLDEQVVDELDAFGAFHRDPHLLDIQTRVKDPAKIDYVLGVIDATVAEYRSAPPMPRASRRSAARSKYGFLMSLQTPESVAARLAPFLALTGDLDGIDQLYATYAAITPAGRAGAAQRYLERGAAHGRRAPVAPVMRAACIAAACAALGLAGCGRAPPPAPTPTEDSPVVLLPVPADPTISFSVRFAVGSQNDPPGKEGLAFLTGQMLSRRRDRNALARPDPRELCTRSPRATRARRSRAQHAHGPHASRQSSTRYLELFTDAFLRADVRASDFERVKQRRDQRDREHAALLLRRGARQGGVERLRVPRHALRSIRPRARSRACKAITLDDVRAFYKSHFTAANALRGVGGGYDDATVARFKAARRQRCRPGAPRRRPRSPRPGPPTGRPVLLIAKPGADASISFGFPIDVHRGDRDFYALWIANSWLGEHRNSVEPSLPGDPRGTRAQLRRLLVHRGVPRRRPHRTMPPVNVPRREQLFEIWIRTLPNEKAVFALRAALRELKSLVDNGLTAAGVRADAHVS